jgi:outer membrane receptor protein involved in Fe transport
MLKRLQWATLAAFIYLFACILPAIAQSTTDGAIGGTVYDANGAVVPSATVVVRNENTNAETTTTSDGQGFFRVIHLQPANYTVTVSAGGFSDYKAEHTVVTVGSLTTLDPRLTVGSTGQTVLVTGETPSINTTSPEFAPTLNQVAIDNLPINGGRWSSFAVLTPGVVSNASGFGLLSFRGISVLLNNNTVDGADNNQAFFSEERGRTRAGYSTPQVAVQEFQVNTSNYSAEYGRSAGGVVNTVTKSGGNQLHGEAYFKDRDNDWGAFNPYTKLAVQTSPGVYTSLPIKPTDWRKIWGFGAGGPIIRDRLFWFFTYDQYKRNFPGTGVASSPGAFFATPTASQIKTLAQNIFNTSSPNSTQLATAQADYNTGLAGLNTMLGATPRTGEQIIFLPKIDWQINGKNHASFVVNRMRWKSPAGIQTQATNTYGIRSFGNDYVKDTWGVAKLDTFLTSNISNEVRFQYGRDFEYENNQVPTPYEQSTFVQTPTYTNPLGLPPQVSITNGFTFGTANFLERPKYPDEYRTQVADTVNWTRGNHNFKFGVDYSHVNTDAANLRNQFGTYSYSNLINYFSDLYTNGAGCSGKPCYSSFSQAFGPILFNFQTNDYAFFAEDDWKLTPRFTVNLGVRYEYEQLPNPYKTLVNPDLPATGQFPSDKNNVGPRVGFAYDVFGNGKTALRGGYGIYYGRVINSTIYSALTSTGNTARDANGVPVAQLSYSYTASQGGPAFPQVFAAPPTGTIKTSAVFFDKNFQLPQVHEFDLLLQQDIGWNTVFQISYLGSLGRELPDFVDVNLNPANRVPITYSVVDSSGAGPLKSPTYGTFVYRTVTTPTGSQTKTGRLNENYGALTDIFSGVNSSYNALAFQVSHNFSHNIQFDAAYTWAHAIDFGQNEATFTDTNDLLDPTNLRLEKGNSIYNVPNRFTVHAVATSPWRVNGWLGYLANEWELAPVIQAQTGLPYSLVTSGTAPGGVSGGVNGSGGAFRLDVTGRNTYKYPGTIVSDVRLSKHFTFADKYKVELLGELFNLANHQNVTGVNNTGYFVGGSTSAPTLTFNTVSGTNAPVFGTVNNSNSNYIYSPRQIQIGARFQF